LPCLELYFNALIAVLTGVVKRCFWCEKATNCRSPRLIVNCLTWSANIRPSTWW